MGLALPSIVFRTLVNGDRTIHSFKSFATERARLASASYQFLVDFAWLHKRNSLNPAHYYSSNATEYATIWWTQWEPLLLLLLSFSLPSLESMVSYSSPFFLLSIPNFQAGRLPGANLWLPQRRVCNPVRHLGLHTILSRHLLQSQQLQMRLQLPALVLFLQR